MAVKAPPKKAPAAKPPKMNEAFPEMSGVFYTIVRHPSEPGNFMLREVNVVKGIVISVKDDVQNLLEYKLALLVDRMRDAAVGRPTVV